MQAAVKMSRLGRAATIYAIELGWRVFPLHSIIDGACSCGSAACTGTKPGKHPRTPRGCLDATTEPAQIRAWWTQWPEANVGVATGGGLVVIDIDPRHGGEDGFDDVVERFGRLPDTVEAVTGSRGRHIYLRVPEGVEVRNSASALAPGVDVRGEGGYVVAAPSSHISGGTYGWELSSRPTEVEVAEMPKSWLDAVCKRPKLRAIKGGAGAGSEVVEGARNDTLFRRACAMRDQGWDEHEILAALNAFNSSKCVPPLDPAEVKAIASSAARYDPTAVIETPRPAVSAEAPADWKTTLTTSKQGAVKNTFANLTTIIRHTEACQSLRLNEMTRAPELAGARCTDPGLSAIREQIERAWGFSPGADSVAAAVALVASERPYHPVRDYLGGLRWDGIERMETVAINVLGAEDTRITRTMLWCWFVSAVARALRPGCKVDTSLVLVGPQGIGKSSFFRILGGEWFSDSAVDIESKDAMLQINAAWIYELGELDHVTSRSHAGRIKAFVSSQVDTYRAPYARAVEAVPRHNVIVGSTNQKQFLADATGDRRFWVVQTTRIDAEALRRDRDQLWAEAVEQYRRGCGWWLGAEAEMAREEATEPHRVADPWEDAVASWLASLSPHEARGVTTQRLLAGACGVEIERVGTRESARIAQIMRRLGWDQRVLRLAGRSTRVWQPIETP